MFQRLCLLDCVGLYLNEKLIYSVLEKTSNENFQALWVEISQPKTKNIICGVIYRQHSCPKEFFSYLDKSLDYYNFKNKTVYICGDFNIDLLKFETCSYNYDLLLSLQSSYLFPTIDKPTRVYNNSATLIDNIFLNQLDRLIFSGNVVSDTSDHFSQFCIIPATKDLTTHRVQKKRLFPKYAEMNFLRELSSIDLNTVLSQAQDVDQYFSTFFRVINNIVNKVAPVSAVSKRKLISFSKPWITQGIRESKLKTDYLSMAIKKSTSITVID